MPDKALQLMQDFISRFTSFSPACFSFVSFGAAEPMPVKVGLFGGAFALVMAGLFGSLGVWMFRMSYKKTTGWRVTYGIVIGFEEKGTSSKTDYYKKVEFQSPDGEKVVFLASTGSGFRPSIGRKVKVLYSPDDPTQADISSFINLWLGPLVFLFFGTAMLIISVLFFCGPFAGKK